MRAVISEQGDFYAALAPVRDFAELAEPARFTPLPADWHVGVADIVDSTGEIRRGRYKTVNTVGAAVISAMMNEMPDEPLPFVFGGDGAAFAVPGNLAPRARRVLANLRRWAEEEFAIPLRAALVPLSDIRAHGRDVRVARYAASDGVDYAMFSGGGIIWAEARMKSGEYLVLPAEPGARPDLTGLSCRWANSRTQHGQIVSVVIQPTPRATDRDFADLARRIVQASSGLERGGHPVAVSGPPLRWPPPGLSIDAHVSRGGGNLTVQKLLLLGQNLLIWLLFVTGLNLGSFDPRHYRRMVTLNTDFRKFDDGLKMTLDCDRASRDRIERLLEEARAQGKIRYGLHAQDEAMMTCIVPSATRDDHLHFIDGASGGYARAAATMRD